MSETSDQAANGSPAPAGDSPTFTLQVISPDSNPLSFADLPVSTTIKELKGRIRNALPSKPADEMQRLIYRGRMLSIESMTMVEVFGSEAILAQETQNIHLVLRQAAPDASNPQPAPPSWVERAPPVPAPQPVLPHNAIPPQFPPFTNRPQSTPATANLPPGLPGMQTQQPLPGFQQMQHTQHIPQPLQQMAQQQHMMAHRLQQLHMETRRLHHEMAMHDPRSHGRTSPGVLNGPHVPPAGPHLQGQPAAFQMPVNVPQMIPQTLQNLINQQQRERAAEGRHGVQDGSTNIHQHHPQTPSGRASPNVHQPAHVTTYTREGVGPNGERFHVTVNETTTTLNALQTDQHRHHMNAHGHPALEVRAILRNADRVLASQNAQNNMPSASNSATAQASPALNVPGTINPSGPLGASSTSVPPIVSTSSAPAQGTSFQYGNITSTESSGEPTVYILSSSNGPRALLVNNAETFFTPRQSRRQSPVGGAGQVIRPPVGLPEFRNRPAGRAGRRHQRGNDNPVPPVHAAHNNPGAGALAAQLGPMLWLVVRLVGFVWFFTSGNTSWARWLMVSGAAFLVFLFNTGIFNGAAEQMWGPIRRHLEALIPLGPAPVPPGRAAAAPEPAVPEAGVEGAPGRRRRPEPEPAQVAARLLEERRQADRGWLMAQFRRAEHALLLFLASLVPGVGERHIAAREAEANAAEAERQRQIQAAEAAEAATAAENAENAGGSGEMASPTAPSAGENTGQPGDQPHLPDQANGGDAPVAPLIEV